eukprot:s1548_g3.t1
MPTGSESAASEGSGDSQQGTNFWSLLPSFDPSEDDIRDVMPEKDKPNLAPRLAMLCKGTAWSQVRQLDAKKLIQPETGVEYLLKALSAWEEVAQQRAKIDQLGNLIQSQFLQKPPTTNPGPQMSPHGVLQEPEDFEWEEMVPPGNQAASYVLDDDEYQNSHESASSSSKEAECGSSYDSRRKSASSGHGKSSLILWRFRNWKPVDGHTAYVSEDTQTAQLDILEVYASPTSMITTIAQQQGLSARRFTYEDGDLSTSTGPEHPIWITLGFQGLSQRRLWVATVAEEAKARSIRFGCTDSEISPWLMGWFKCSTRRARMGQSAGCEYVCPKNNKTAPPEICESKLRKEGQPEAEEDVSVVASLDGDVTSPGLFLAMAEHGPSPSNSSEFPESVSCSSPVANSVVIQVAVSARSVVSATSELNVRSMNSKVTKRSRLEKTLHLHLDIDILRAVPLRSAMCDFGAMWRMNPRSCTSEELQKVYEKSRSSSYYDLFLSHTWLTPGWQKFGSMLLRHHWPQMLLGWFAGTSVAVVLVLSGTLHLNLFQSIDFDQDYDGIEFAPYSTTFGLLGAAIALVSSPTLQLECCKAPSYCFLDIACVHQTDPELRERGVYGIGGWLSVSKELRILWSPPYFSRLWCVFEVAAYRIANPKGKITFQPVFVENLVIIAWLCVFMIVWFDISGLQFPEFRWLFLLVEFLMTVLVILPLKVLWAKKRQAIADLRDFTLSEVVCGDETFDRPFVCSAIKGWYGSLDGFTDFVRGPLRQDLLNDFSTVHLPFAYYFMIASPFFGRYLDYSLAMWSSGTVHHDVIWSYFLAMGLSRGGIMIIAIKAIFLLVDFFAASPKSCLARTCIQTSIILLVITGLVWGHRQLAELCYSQGLEASLALAAATVVLSMCVFISFRCRSRQQRERNRSYEFSYED